MLAWGAPCLQGMAGWDSEMGQGSDACSVSQRLSGAPFRALHVLPTEPRDLSLGYPRAGFVCGAVTPDSKVRGGCSRAGWRRRAECSMRVPIRSQQEGGLGLGLPTSSRPQSSYGVAKDARLLNLHPCHRLPAPVLFTSKIQAIHM